MSSTTMPDFDRQSNGQHFLRIKNVCELTALSQSFIYAQQAKGQFPRSRKIASKVSVWRASDVDEWIQQQWDQAA